MTDEQNKKDQSPENNPESKVNTGNANDTSSISRRNVLKFGALGAAGAALGGGLGYLTHSKLKGTPMKDIRPPDQISKAFKPKDQRDVVLGFATSKKLNEKHPERNETYNKVTGKNFNFYEGAVGFEKGPYRNEPGYTQLDRALADAGWHPCKHTTPGMEFCQPNSGLFSWDQSGVAETQYRFETKEEASLKIKSAARIFGVSRCGITRRDRRWDYDPLYDTFNEKELSWDKDFPFEPKTVIVLLTEMDYLAMSTAPSWSETGTVGNGYSEMSKVSSQMAEFIRKLGYQAVAAGNDLGLSVPYAMMAGLGEGARNGCLIAPGLGPRLRICKVYTDFDFVEYDQPRNFGVLDFCSRCMRCAESCPSKAITFEDEPTMGPTYSDDPDYTWNSHPGIMKFHNDPKKCFNFWIENDGDCGNCICSCPYNKPDFWHHRLVDASNVLVPGFVHSIMKQFDIIFGYGNVSDPKALKKLWESGKEL